MGIADLAAATPASRERYVDFLRAVSILVVVVGHWTIALIFRDDGVILEDLGTSNGTFLDDDPVKGECAVPDGSRIRFATVEFTVTFLRSEG